MRRHASGGVDQIGERGDVTVLEDMRYVQDRSLGKSSPEFARRVQQYIEYYPEPPYEQWADLFDVAGG